MAKLILFDMEGTLTHEDAALPGTARFLEFAATTDWKLALVSDLPKEKVKEKLTGAGLSPDAFGQILSTTHYAEAFTEAAAHAGVTPTETVVCSASMVGVKIAGRCGMTAVAVKARFSEEMYRKAGAEYVCTTLAELPGILGFVG